jgi:hypothetical protein
MPLIGGPPNDLAAVSLIRAAIADDADSGILMLLPLAAVSARALPSAHGYNAERTLKVLDTWAAEYADDPAGC